MPKLADKVAVITGGTTGIGLATAERFIDEGAEVVVIGRDPERVRSASERLGKNALLLTTDVRSVSALRTTFVEIHRKLGRIDVLFANAGISRACPFEEVTETEFDEQMEVNARGIFFTVQAASPYLQEGASVILNSSINARVGWPGMSVYSASKAAVRSFARSLGAELAPRGIRVNSISPGPVDTPMMTKLRDHSGLAPDGVARLVSTMQSQLTIGRASTAAEIAGVVLFLASADSSFMLGSDVVVDGGLVMV
jgi:NAD(P)-dependent dehydrogenase (short-subunit alcohol dehydrogenase family)